MNGAPAYVRFTLRLRGGTEEAAAAALLELPTPGWQERPSGDGLLFWLVTSALDDVSVRTTLERLRRLGALEAAPETGDWEQRRRHFHRPVHVGRVLVRPPWAPPDPEALDVLVDFGMAFGTGSHPTTCRCLLLLQTIAPGSLLDLGCGTGVLSVAAMRLGYGPVYAVDNDEVATSAAAANALLNGAHVDLICGDATDPAVELPHADVVAANIALRPIVALGRRLGSSAPAQERGGRPASDRAAAAGPWRPRDVILAGLLATQVEEALAAWPAYAMVGRSQDEEWCTLHLRPAVGPVRHESAL